MRILRFIGALLIVLASPAMAKDGAAWIVTQKSGDVRVLRNGVQPASLAVRSALSAGDVIATGSNGRAMLTRGGDYVVVAPGRRLLLPKEEQKSGFTRLIQQVGTMLYKVKHTGVPHFAVETPILAAVVKGTSFTVVVDDKRAAVQVTEGLVEVSAATGDARRLVEGGMTVYVGRERPSEIVVVKPGDPVAPSLGGNEGDSVKVESSGDVPLSAVTDLTGGLVREAPTAPVAVATAPNADVLTATVADTSTTPATATDIVATPAAEVVTATAPTVTDPVVAIADTVAPVVTDPVVAIVDTVAPVVTQPIVEIVQTTVPVVTQPVVEIVQTTVPVVTQPVVEIVQATVPAVTQPVVTVIEPVVQPVVAVVQPVVQPVVAVVQPVVQPVVAVVQPIVQPVVQPVVAVVQPIAPAITQPVTGILGGILGGGKGP